MLENVSALSNFVDENGLEKDDFSRGSFRGRATLNSSGGEISSFMKVRFSFFSDFEERLVLEEVGDFSAGKTPIGFKTDYGVWKCINGVLQISDKYPGLGQYKLSVSV
jgi:hypothetical protein